MYPFYSADPSSLLIVSDHVKLVYKETRLAVDEDTWPPERPEDFTPVVLLHYKNLQNFVDDTIVETVHSGRIDDVVSVINNDSVSVNPYNMPLREALKGSKVTKDIRKILEPLANSKRAPLILIEGAPGIGKSVLLKEISYKWAINEVLQNFDLVLLVCLRDPNVHQMTELKQLFYPFCQYSIKNRDIAATCSEYFFNNGGENLTLLLDGYDEFPDDLRTGLIRDILKRKLLPKCGLVVSSRPHASVDLRQWAGLHIEILGFTELEREHYVQHALKDQPQRILELTEYLKQHLAISGLCFVPFNLSILVHIYKQGILLPKNSTDLYNYFICLTICRHLVKNGIAVDKDLTAINQLPEPYCKVVQQFSKLSLDALNRNQIIFSLKEIKSTCPEIDTIPGAINGFGLLQTIQHYGISRRKQTFNFLHFSLQEFLAANYVTQLPRNEQLSILKRYFGNDTHLNMFSFYVAITKGQNSALKQFVSGRDGTLSALVDFCTSFKPFQSTRYDVNTIDKKFYNDYLKCIHLYRCFNETNDTHVCSTIIKRNFSSRELNFFWTTLSIHDIEAVEILLTASSIKQWAVLNLTSCHIKDIGLQVLHRSLKNSGITIEELKLCNNNLSASSGNLISDLVRNCAVKHLDISCNEEAGQTKSFLRAILQKQTMLETLCVTEMNLSFDSIRCLFMILRERNSIKSLDISYNNITDDACYIIAQTLKINKSLEKLWINDSISVQAATAIVLALQQNCTLSLLGLPSYSRDIAEDIQKLSKRVNLRRRHKGFQLDIEFSGTSRTYVEPQASSAMSTVSDSKSIWIMLVYNIINSSVFGFIFAKLLIEFLTYLFIYLFHSFISEGICLFFIICFQFCFYTWIVIKQPKAIYIYIVIVFYILSVY